MTPDQPEPVDFSDFTADVAARTGSSADELSGRAGPAEAADPLVASARESQARHSSAESSSSDLASRSILPLYEGEVERLKQWVKPRKNSIIEALDTLAYSERNGIDHEAPSLEQLAERIAQNPRLYAEKVEEGFDDLCLVPNALPFGAASNEFIETARTVALRGELRGMTGAITEHPQLSYFPNSGLHAVTFKREFGPGFSPLELSWGWSPVLVNFLEARGGHLSDDFPRGLTPVDFRKTLYDSGDAYKGERFMSPLEYVVFLLRDVQTAKQLLPEGSLVMFPDHTTSFDNCAPLLYVQRSEGNYRFMFDSTATVDESINRALQAGSAFAPRCVPLARNLV